MDVTRPIHHQVQGISFHLLNPDRIRRLSVKSITNATIFDQLGHPNIGGLYDPALGPIDKNGRCTTCGLGFFQCPGHFGHIELAVPVYAPLTFAQMFQVLRLCCLYCHRLRVGPLKTQLCLSKLQLLALGLLVEAKELDALLQQTIPGENDTGGSEETSNRRVDVEALVHRIKVHTAALRQQHRETSLKPSTSMIGAVAEYRQQVVMEFLKSVGASNSCQHCRGFIPTMYRHGGTKVFINPLRKSHQLVMEAKGMDVDRIFKSPNDNEEDSQEDGPSNGNVDENGDIRSTKGMKFLTPMHVYEHLRQLWKNESALLNLLFSRTDRRDRSGFLVTDHRIFFTETLAVPPCRFRPPSVFGGETFDHPQNSYLVEIIKLNQKIVELRASQPTAGKKDSDSQDLAPQNKKELDKMLINHKEIFAELIRTWVSLQEQVNFLFDSSHNTRSIGHVPPPGIKQILEKKEGLFRKHMMGKRVNFAARSVISPDPHLETGEIGVPLVFATRLTYPEPVAEYNIAQLRQAVINGPEAHPGATHVQMEDGSLANLEVLSKPARLALANRLRTPSSPSSTQATSIGVKRVYRHIRNGDIVLMNRQPTLHKPSIMAHRVRVLPGEKTLRMHYANCNTYNADFDGDEMNLHFPQSELARAEAYGIAATAQQYLVPTDGSPLRGLIQDHIVTGVLLTLKDTWMTRDVFQQLLWGSLPETDLPKVQMLPPAILAPRPLWSGKQLVSAVLLNLARGRPPLTFTSGGKIGTKLWGPSHAQEATVTVLQGDLLTGVMDKSQLGASSYGLTHAFYEAYGPEGAASLLTAMGRLLTRYDQWIGFTCRMDDLLLNEEADTNRRRFIEASHPVGRQAVASYAHLPPTAPIDEVRIALEHIVRTDELARGLDREFKGRTNTLTSQIIDACIPSGQLRPFPHNHMSLMTNSGAKGSMVNFSQITGLLGQQELEGRRVPVMVSGKTLPCFPAWDPRARAGGYITQRFLTGIRPPEFFFHCMAGREGLIDTAVKTSRSGYLQRCLVKHLESLRINYDGTVRDAADGSIIQFQYGEDGLDVTKQKYLNKLDFAEANFPLLLEQCQPQVAWDRVNTERAIKAHRKLMKRRREGRPLEADPVLSRYPPSVYLGSVSEKFMSSLVEYKPESLDVNVFQATMLLKYMRSMVEAGEAVGVLAAQSVGEPSTQMTLNTFHFAGFGAKNVTLGIPRLREIIMTASARTKTPSVTIPLRPGLADNINKVAEESACRLSRLTLRQLVRDVGVVERLMPCDEKFLGTVAVNLGRRARVYSVRIDLMSSEEAEELFAVRLEGEVRDAVENGLMRLLLNAIEKSRKKKKIASANGTPSGDLVTKSAESRARVSAAIATEGGDEDEGRREASGTGHNSKVDDDSSSEDEVEHDDAEFPEQKIQEYSDDAESTDDDTEERLAPSESDDDDEDTNDIKQEYRLDSLLQNKRSSQSERQVIKEARNGSFLSQARSIRGYSFDITRGRVQFDLVFPASHHPILMLDVIERVVNDVIVRQVPGINRVFVTREEGASSDNNLALTAEGSNLRSIWDHPLVFSHLDLSHLLTNDIHAMLVHYGVEAARATIVREVAAVFAVYGISVDVRHLYLIADYMTVGGGYRPLNRQGMAGQASPLLRMTFETTVGFLRTAALLGETDGLGSPSASIVMGRPVSLGTGAFEVRHQLSTL